MRRTGSRPVAPRLAAILSAALLGVPVWAQAPEEKPAAAAGEAQELSKKLSNPIADLVSIPFQFNWQNGSARIRTCSLFSMFSRSCPSS